MTAMKWLPLQAKLQTLAYIHLRLPEKTVAIRELSLFLSISITPGGRVSRFFSRNPVASYSTCGSRHRIQIQERDLSLPRANPRCHQFPLTSKTSLASLAGRSCHSGWGRDQSRALV